MDGKIHKDCEAPAKTELKLKETQKREAEGDLLGKLECTLSLHLPLTIAVGKCSATPLTASRICGGATEKVSVR